MDTQVVAYSPNELVAAQATVRGWCAENIRRLLSQKRDAEANVQTALAGHFNSKPFKAQVRRAQRRIDYYKKIGKAIKLGYMIVPNFDVDLFAVRTSKKRPRHTESWGWHNFSQTGEILPEGRGRYVDPEPFEVSEIREVENHNGELVERKYYWPVAFDEEITFPVSIIKPHIIKETKRAMGFKLFDQIGVVRGQRFNRADPIVCGTICEPTNRNKGVTFFIAWWLDREDI